MQLLRLSPYTAPQRFVFKDPDSGREYKAKTKEELIKSIVSYRVANGLAPITRLDIVLDNYWASLPENRHNAETAPPLSRGFLAYLKGGVALIENIAFGDKRTVSQTVADARAAQCVNCKFNQFPDKGPFVSWTDQIAEHSVGNKKTAYHERLGNCMVCSCVLKAKCWWGGPILLSEEEKEKMRTVNCWQLRGNDGRKA